MTAQVDEARAISLKVLDDYELTGKSVRFLLRQLEPRFQQDSSLRVPVLMRVIGVVKFLNTIDFIAIRALGQKKLSSLSIRKRSVLRLVTYELRWLKEKSNQTSFYEDLFPGISRYSQRVLDFDLRSSLKGMNEIGALSVKYSHPSFMVQTFLENLPHREVIELMNANNESRKYYFRINQLIADADEVSEGLMKEGVSIEADPTIPLLYKAGDGIDNLFSSKFFKSGEILVQDRSSVLAARALDPKPGMKVWDACAAPGMKTHVLWEMMQQKGALIATDVHPKRLRSAEVRGNRIGLEDVQFMVADAMTAPIDDADRILIDAPCSSTGILRSHPSYKWRLNRSTLLSIMAIQNKMLEGILGKYQERGGTEIVYATCSLLPHEGESQIDSILSKFNVELLEIPFAGSGGYPQFRCSKKALRLFPSKHDSSGFFISRLRVTG